MSEEKCAEKSVDGYAADCVSGISWVPATLVTLDVLADPSNASISNSSNANTMMVVDNTEGTGAYDDLGADALVAGTTNFDNGGCSLDVNTEHLLKTYGVVNHVYDKMKRSATHNAKVLQLVDTGQFDTSTSNSVLNVINDKIDTASSVDNSCNNQPNQLDEHIALSYRALKTGGKAYFKIWRGDGSGTPSVNLSGSYQHNLPASAFLPAVRRIFLTSTSSASLVVAIDHLNLIIATKEKKVKV